METPSLEDLQVSGLFAPIKFANYGGYQFAPTFIEYLIEKDEKDKLIDFIYSGSLEESYGVILDQVYDGWLDWLKSHPAYGVTN